MPPVAVVPKRHPNCCTPRLRRQPDDADPRRKSSSGDDRTACNNRGDHADGRSKRPNGLTVMVNDFQPRTHGRWKQAKRQRNDFAPQQRPGRRRRTSDRAEFPLAEPKQLERPRVPLDQQQLTGADRCIELQLVPAAIMWADDLAYRPSAGRQQLGNSSQTPRKRRSSIQYGR